MSESAQFERRMRLTDKTSVQLGIVITFCAVLVGLTGWAYAIQNNAAQAVRELVEVKTQISQMNIESAKRAEKFAKFENIMDTLTKAVDKLTEHDELKMQKISEIQRGQDRVEAKLEVLTRQKANP